MDPSPSSSLAQAGRPTTTIYLDDPLWRRTLGDPERLIRRAIAATGTSATVVLTSDQAVQRLNARHRGQNKPTNVLTFEAAHSGLPGDIVLALGTVLREARAAGRHPATHLAHLVIHGGLHLRGPDHHQPGEARRMEMAESRAMARLGLPNPWKISPGKTSPGKSTRRWA
jgi:probable rRNA maturation factor